MKETMNNLKKVYKYGKDYNKNLIAFTILSFAFVVVNVIYPIFTAKQITYLSTGLFKQLAIVTLVVFGLELLRILRMVLIKRNTQVYFTGVFKNLQLAVSKEILKIKVSDIDNNSSGVFIERINGDCSQLSHIFTIGCGNLTAIVSNLGIFIAIFLINKYIFLYYLFISIVLTILHVIKNKVVGNKDKIYRRKKDHNVGLTSELVRGVRDVKMLNAKESFIKEIEKSINDGAQRQFEMRNTDTGFLAIIQTVKAVLETILILILIYLVSIDNINIGTALILHSYKHEITSNLIEQIGRLLEELKNFNISANRVFSLLGNNEFKKETFGKKHLDKVEGNFEFKNVEFAYDKEKVLDKMNFKVNANETIGFVGKSGAGKTTIFNLLCKMYEPQKGTIYLDGIDIQELDEDSIRGNITIISQNPYIFNLSIKDNLRLVKDDLTEEEMKEACHLACIDDYIESLPEKYDTVVGEGGVILSGGQRQRLAIARAFVQKTEIILFDEATSALDNETQQKIQQAINNMKKEYTILIIAHRLTTIINCDKICFIENGKIIATGTHEELLKSCPEYKHLYISEILKNDEEEKQKVEK